MSGLKKSVQWNWLSYPQIIQERPYTMGVQYINPEDHGRQITPPEQNVFGSTLTLDRMNLANPPNLIKMQLELIELRNTSARQQVYLFLCMSALVFTACIAIGLSTYLFLLRSG